MFDFWRWLSAALICSPSRFPTVFTSQWCPSLLSEEIQICKCSIFFLWGTYPGYRWRKTPSNLCSLHTAAISSDALLLKWKSLLGDQREALLTIEVDEFKSRLQLHLTDVLRVCQCCRSNVLDQMKKLKPMKQRDAENGLAEGSLEVISSNFGCQVDVKIVYSAGRSLYLAKAMWASHIYSVFCCCPSVELVLEQSSWCRCFIVHQ